MPRRAGDQADPMEVDDQLHLQFLQLQDDWASYKQSLPRPPRRRRSCSTTDIPSSTATMFSAPYNFFELINDSPKKLISSLQHQTLQPPSHYNTVYFNPAASFSPSPFSSSPSGEETVVERPRAALRGAGKATLRGRRLLDELERAKDDGDVARFHGREEICSVCSSVFVHGAEVNSCASTCCSSCAGQYSVHRIADCIHSSSSSSYLEEEEERVGSGSGIKRMIKMVLCAVVLAVASALGFISLGIEEDEDFMIPT